MKKSLVNFKADVKGDRVFISMEIPLRDKKELTEREREVLKVCDDFLNRPVEEGVDEILSDHLGDVVVDIEEGVARNLERYFGHIQRVFGYKFSSWYLDSHDEQIRNIYFHVKRHMHVYDIYDESESDEDGC